MPRTLTSKVILCKNIKLDKKYMNVLNYTENQMLSLCRSQGHLIREVMGYSFIRQQDKLQTSFSFSECLQANYIAFQNPDYANTWFFAFIDDVKYISDNNTEISFTIDIWSSYFGYWQAQPCFVVREHVNDDTVGLHTLPEGLETGSYIDNISDYYTGLDDICYIIQSTEPAGSPSGAVTAATNYGGIFMAGTGYITDNINDFVGILRAYAADNKMEAVYNCYIVPKNFSPFAESVQAGAMTLPGMASPKEYDYSVNKPTELDGYVPKNKKLLTFPFCFLEVNNNSGITNTYKYEFFSSNMATFKIKGVHSVGGSIKCVPYTYNKNINNEEEGIMAGKFPTMNWSVDNYLAWLSQQSLNLNQGIQSGALQIATGVVAMGLGQVDVGGGLAGSGLGNIGGSIINYMRQQNLAELAPNTTRGNTNGGDINICSHKNGFFFYGKSIRREYAKKIDDYFTRLGYQINEIKAPNLTGRRNFNYVQIGDSENIGYGSVPTKFMDVINNVFRRGVTIWHNHDNLGNYSVNNDII